MSKPAPPSAPEPLNWYGLKRLGYNENSLPLTGERTRDQVMIEATCLRIEHAPEEGGLGPFGHYKNYVDLLWNNPDSGSFKRCIWNRWSSLLAKKMCEEPVLGVAGCASAGKCFGVGTEVLMFDGSVKKVEEIVAGDEVMGDDGTKRTVQEVHTGRSPLMKVTPYRGEPWYCTENHILVLMEYDGGFSPVEIPAKEFSEFSDEKRLGYFQYRSPGFITGKSWRSGKPGWRTGPITVTPAHEGDWVGFSVDGNHRFLLADFTVVHNSDPAALYGVVRYTTDPSHTLVLVMSTSLKEAKKRIWKTLMEYWEAIPGLPGRFLKATNEIKGLNYRGDGYGDSSGIYLMAAEQGSERDAVNKLIGIKAPRTGTPGSTYEELIRQPEYADLRKHFDEETLRGLVPRLHNLSQDRIGRLILIIDEMTGVAEAVLTAVNTNLRPGNVGHFQIIGLGNPNLPYDTFGLFCKPKGGYSKVDLLKDEEWETEQGGLCIRFNAEKNPRIIDNDERCSWMPRKEDIAQMEQTYGRDSLYYHRMVLGTWSLGGSTLGIYTPADIEMSGAKEQKVTWGMVPSTPVSFLDPSFTSGGDRAFATFGLCGIDAEGTHVLLITERITIQTNPNSPNDPVSYQIIRQWRTECEKRKVKPQHAAYDKTGGGLPFGNIVAVTWSPLVVGIDSAGPATQRILPNEKDQATGKNLRACDRFANRATEIWYSAHPLFRSGQIFGVTDDLARELCSRQHDKTGSGNGRQLKVEKKRVYKDREGKSPDESDSFLGLVDFCRSNLGLKPAEIEEIRKNSASTETGKSAWKQLQERARRLTARRGLKRHDH